MELWCEGLTGRHPAAPVLALQALSVRLAPGEQVAVIGPSGAGKTTLLHLLACALRPSQGRVSLGGQDPWSLSTQGLQALRGRLFLAPQVPPLPARQRVVASVLAGQLPNLGFWASVRQLLLPRDLERAHQALAAFDLAEKLFERVDRLSGGERQRVGLARLLASDAELLLVDEPLSALDPHRADQALHTLTSAAAARQATLLASLHQVDLALRHFPRVLGLREGQLVFDRPATDVDEGCLRALYGQTPPPYASDVPLPQSAPPAPRAPVPMHCR